MNWKLDLHRTRHAYVRDYSFRAGFMMTVYGYDTAAKILDVQEAMVLGLVTLVYHDSDLRRDGRA